MSKISSKQEDSLLNLFGETLTEKEALSLIASDPEAQQLFESLTTEFQQKAISFVQGNTGLKILSDKCFQDIMKPRTHPERLSSLLSAILNKKIVIKSVIPRTGEKMADGGSFVIMDILVEDTKGSTINVEIQRVGYLFPGERSCCYLSDLVMRQYNVVRLKMGKRFSYHKMKPIILIVIMENSSDNFKAVTPQYIHHERSVIDSGAVVTNLTETIYISLDTFRSVSQNISTKLDAWLTFLGSDSPADILKLINAYPEFIEYYKDIAEYRRHPKELMNMFSEALAIMDRNMEQYMIDEWKATIEDQKSIIKENEAIIKENEAIIKENEAIIKENEAIIENQKSTIAERDSTIAERDSTIAERDSIIQKLESIIEAQNEQNRGLQAKLDLILSQMQSK